MDAASLAEFVLRQIEDFQVPDPHPLQLGSPLPPDWFARRLAEIRSALVEPYVIEITDGRFPQHGSRRVWIVAQDADTLLVYDPDPEGDFALIFKDAPQPGLSPIRGGAVDCFMAR